MLTVPCERLCTPSVLNKLCDCNRTRPASTPRRVPSAATTGMATTTSGWPVTLPRSGLDTTAWSARMASWK